MLTLLRGNVKGKVSVLATFLEVGRQGLFRESGNGRGRDQVWTGLAVFGVALGLLMA